ncbi:MAG: hypothetical protein FWG64_03420 [Firmicutes bacterium]|nr:hypothetical protein [Bacillota bacterium]
MEKIQVSQEKLMPLFSKRYKEGLGLLIGVAIAVGIINIFEMPPGIFAIIGIMVFGAIVVWQAYTAQKSVKSGNYECFKTKCEKTNKLLESCYVANNEILPGNKPLKRLDFAGTSGSLKSINVGDEIGVLRVGKDFWAFSLEDVK